MPLAFLCPFGLSLCPRPAESLLPFRRNRTTEQDSGQEQSNHHLTRHGSHGWLVAELLDHLIRPLQDRLREGQHDVEPRVVMAESISQCEEVGREGASCHHGTGIVADGRRLS
jgi:hypothetical protein